LYNWRCTAIGKQEVRRTGVQEETQGQVHTPGSYRDARNKKRDFEAGEHGVKVMSQGLRDKDQGGKTKGQKGDVITNEG